MFGISSSEESGRVVAVADVGSASASVAIAHILPGNPAAVLVAKRLMLPLEERTPEQAKAGVVTLLSTVAEKALAAYAESYAKRGKSVSSVYAVIRAPWVRSRTARAMTIFEREETITEEILSGLARQALGTEQEPVLASLIGLGVIKVELNGYVTTNPLGKSAHAAAVSALVSECESAVRAQVTEALQRVFGTPPILRAQERALISIMHESPLRPHNQTIIDIGSDATECIVIRKGVAADHALVAEGTYSMLKRVSGGGLPDETLSVMRMMNKDACSSDACKALSESLARAEPDLVRVFGEALGKLAAVRRLPNDMLIAVDPEFAPWLVRFFSRIDFGQFTVTTQPFAPSILVPQDLDEHVLSDEGKEIDFSLALAVSAVNREELSA